jgi:hypothetical protein
MFNKQPIKLTALADIAGYSLTSQVDSRQPNACISKNIYRLILMRFQDEPNSGRVSAWQDHAGLIHSLLSGRK